jgi:hypothetical protein
MSDFEEQSPEGGDTHSPQLAQAFHEGGALLRNVGAADETSANSAVRPEGVESTLRIDAPVAPCANAVGLRDGERVAVTSFNFISPFQPPATSDKVPDASKENVHRPNPPPAMLRALPPGDSSAVIASASVANTIPFSKMSASDLGQIVAGKIHGFNLDLWNSEDVSGSAIIGHIAPSDLSNFLEQVLNIRSPFIKSRVQCILVSLIEKDLFIGVDIRDAWSQLNKQSSGMFGDKRVLATPAHQLHAPTPVPTPQTLFSTPNSGGAARTSFVPSTPAFFGGRKMTNEQSLNHGPPPFLRECGSPNDFQMDDTTLFAQTTRASVSGSASNIGQALGGGIQITINQPSATPPKYVVLNCASDSTEFYNWIRKNTKESLLALPVDRRNLSQLVSEDVKEEVARIIRQLGPTNTFYFDADSCPYPKSWPEVSDHLLKKILFGINGPRSAAEAKLKLKLRLFFFNDSTTSQDKLLAKLRKFCNDFKATLKDFSYTFHMWEEADKLSHEMIIEAFSDCFTNSEQIKGPDGTTMVPKSRNYAKIKEMIRERKGQSLEEIIHFIIDSFERVDLAVRSSRSIAYDIKPWKNDDSKKKRGVNQISGGAAQQPGTKKPPRPPTDHPRCANCGRKSHACGERSCYLFGHPEARGATGVWSEGEPSLFIEKDKMKAWKLKRDPVFYGYTENQRPKKDSA